MCACSGCLVYGDVVFFFNDTATTEIYTLPYTTLFRSEPDLPIPRGHRRPLLRCLEQARRPAVAHHVHRPARPGARVLRSEEHTSELQSRQYLVCRLLLEKKNNISHTRHPLHLANHGLY